MGCILPAMKVHLKSYTLALLLAPALLAFFTVLLCLHRIGEPSYVGLLILTAFVTLATSYWGRVEEINLKEFKLVLAKLEQVKAEIEEMYGGIDAIKRQPYIMDKAKLASLGMSDGTQTFGNSVMRYTAGCMKRERERLARIFVTDKTPEKLAEAILDASLDDLVFKWNGPEHTLDDPPKSLAQREAEENAKNAAENPQTSS
jgi:hypothetical protein